MGSLTEQEALKKYDCAADYDEPIRMLREDVASLKNQIKSKRHQIAELVDAAERERRQARLRQSEPEQMEME